MADRYDTYWRLEPDPTRRRLTEGFQAGIHDPLWFLARQWQMGEHQGENASTPVLVDFEVGRTSLQAPLDDPGSDPTVVPAEAIVEAEPDSWWTTGRRLRVGAVLVARHGIDVATVDPGYRFADPPPPYEHLAGRLDGLAAWRAPAGLGLGPGTFADIEVPAARPFRWDSAELAYQISFPLGDGTLELPRHRGGRVDWFSGAATGNAAPTDTAATRAYPSPFHYPGAPRARWWEIEDAAVDIAGYPPDSSHFATTLLIELISTHGDDWFVFPVDAEVGQLVAMPDVTVTDSFGETYEVAPPVDPWWLFHTNGLDERSLVLWLRALTPLDGPPLDEVLVGLDEYSNQLWAVELRVAGHELAAPSPSDPLPSRAGQPAPAPSYVYAAGRGATLYWHPYEIDERPGPDGMSRRRFVQRRLANLAPEIPALLPAPVAQVLRAWQNGIEVIHEIEPATIPSIGLVLERRYRLARDTAGNPVLWAQRQRTPFLRPPARQMRFDVLLADTPPA